MKRILSFFITAVLLAGFPFLGYLSAQNNNPFVQRAQYVSQQNNSKMVRDSSGGISKLLSEATEDVSQRTLYSSTFKTKDGQVICQYSNQMINYYNAQGQLVPVKTELKSCSSGWVADQQPNPCYFHSDRSTGITMDDGSEMKFNQNNKINGISYQQQLTSVSKSGVSLDLTSDIHKKISFLINGIKTDYVFDRAVGNDIEVAEDLDFPKGATLKPDKKRGKMINGMWQGDYLLIGADGKQLASFAAPLCYDSKKSGCVGYYHDAYKDGKHILYTVVPTKWLSQATYPVTIDPTVMGPVSHWPASRNVPSGDYPTFVTDSILVTIPGKITITRLYASFCFITDIANGVQLTWGRIFFRTKCATTPVLQCMNTTLAGTCYLDTLNNNNDFGPQGFDPLTCCFSPSCSPQTFYFTAGLARDCPPATPCNPPGEDSTHWLWSPAAPNPFPFYAYIVGRTDSATWSINPASVCSNECTLNLSVSAQYGVPPYTITHPWATPGPHGFGTATSCNSSTGNITIPLTIPGCPTFCGSPKNLTVPPPIVYDFCNDTVQGLVAKTVVINPVPKITVTPDSLITCGGIPLDFKVSSCTPNTVITWKGNDHSSGTDSLINYVPKDTVNGIETINYVAYSNYSGCEDSSNHFYVKISQSPSLSTNRDTTILQGNPVPLFAVSNGISYNWYPSTGLSCTTCPDPVATPTVTTKYYVTVAGADGCIHTDSVVIFVNAQQISIPNIFTPNGDGKNDLFYIKNLQYYPNSQLLIYDRWGAKVFETTNYQNNWTGGGQSDGVYYYVLTLYTGKKYDGYVQILR